MQKAEYEIAVIGGGLAGLATSIQLAKLGRKVVLLEKNEFPFHKVCGEYISMESWDFLCSLGLPLEELGLPIIKRLEITTGRGSRVEHPLDLGGFGISRFRLDQMLADIAVAEGVEVVTRAKVTGLEFEGDVHRLRSSKGECRAKVVVGAFGKRSVLDKQLNRKFMEKPLPVKRNFTGVKYHVEADLPADLIGLHIFKDGYCGISKVEGEGRYCMCYLTTAANLQACGGDIRRMEEEILWKNPVLKEYFQRFPSLHERPLVISQVNFSKKKAVEGHILMAGDAAGLIAPLSGNGMSMALHGSKLLVPLVEGFLAGELSRGEMEEAYKKVWTRQFGGRLRIGRSLQHLFFGELATHYALKVLRPFPGLLDRVVRATHGKRF